MNRLDKILYSVDQFVCTVTCVLMVSIVSIEVILRYCFHTTLMVGIQEIAVWAFIWMVAMVAPPWSMSTGTLRWNTS